MTNSALLGLFLTQQMRNKKVFPQSHKRHPLKPTINIIHNGKYWFLSKIGNKASMLPLSTSVQHLLEVLTHVIKQEAKISQTDWRERTLFTHECLCIKS